MMCARVRSVKHRLGNTLCFVVVFGFSSVSMTYCLRNKLVVSRLDDGRLRRQILETRTTHSVTASEYNNRLAFCAAC